MLPIAVLLAAGVLLRRFWTIPTRAEAWSNTFALHITHLAQVLVIQGAMPAALSPVILAQHYGGDRPTAAAVAVITTSAALIGIPLWILIGSKPIVDWVLTDFGYHA